MIHLIKKLHTVRVQHFQIPTTNYSMAAVLSRKHPDSASNLFFSQSFYKSIFINNFFSRGIYKNHTLLISANYLTLIIFFGRGCEWNLLGWSANAIKFVLKPWAIWITLVQYYRCLLLRLSSPWTDCLYSCAIQNFHFAILCLQDVLFSWDSGWEQRPFTNWIICVIRKIGSDYTFFIRSRNIYLVITSLS